MVLYILTLAFVAKKAKTAANISIAHLGYLHNCKYFHVKNIMAVKASALSLTCKLGFTALHH